MTVSEKADLVLPQEKEKDVQVDLNKYERMEIGVWEIFFAEKSPAGLSTLFYSLGEAIQRQHNLKESLPFLWRLINESYLIDPFIVILLSAMELLSALIPTCSLYFNNTLFSTVCSNSPKSCHSRQLKINLRSSLVLRVGSTTFLQLRRL
jgi:hypothetical protein